jgi:cytolysin-activating lysine-acyltransferase
MMLVDGAPPGRVYGFFEILGMMTAISLDTHYRNYSLEQLGSYLIPPLDARQFKVYLDDKGRPAAFVTWALVDGQHHRALHDQGINPPPGKWSSGSNLWFTDLVAPAGDVRAIVRDIQKNIFPDRHAYSIRRNAVGGVKRICIWKNALVAK